MKAFPTPFIHDGLDLRDYFAARAMQSIITICPKELPDFDLAIDAYKMADAMMKAREYE
jgi:hypothetical protein